MASRCAAGAPPPSPASPPPFASPPFASPPPWRRPVPSPPPPSPRGWMAPFWLETLVGVAGTDVSGGVDGLDVDVQAATIVPAITVIPRIQSPRRCDGITTYPPFPAAAGGSG